MNDPLEDQEARPMVRSRVVLIVSYGVLLVGFTGFTLIGWRRYPQAMGVWWVPVVLNWLAFASILWRLLARRRRE